MKTRFLILGVISFFISVHILGQNNNIKLIKAGREMKEYILYEDNISKPLTKTTYNYDDSGNIISRISYKWNNHCWLACQKHEFIYDIKNNKLQIIQYTEWDKKNNDWSKRIKNLVHTYNSEGKLLSLKTTTEEIISNIALVLK